MDKTNNGGALTFANRIFDLQTFADLEYLQIADLQIENICRLQICRLRIFDLPKFADWEYFQNADLQIENICRSQICRLRILYLQKFAD